MAEGRKGFFSRLVEGLTKTRNNIVSGIDSIFSGFSAIDDDFYEEIEETLIMGDLGIETTMSIVENLRRQVKEKGIKEPEECKELLIESIKAQMDLGENAYEFENRKSVVLVIGVNGVGKTTSVGKLAGQLKDSGRAEYVTVTDEEAVNAFMVLSRREGIIPALESSHALAHAMRLAPTLDKDKIIMVCLSGRGDKDVTQIAELLKGKM